MGGSREPFVILRTLPQESRRLLSLSGIKVSGARLILEGSSGINLCWNADLRQVSLDGVVADSLPTSSVCEVDKFRSPLFAHALWRWQPEEFLWKDLDTSVLIFCRCFAGLCRAKCLLIWPHGCELL